MTPRDPDPGPAPITARLGEPAPPGPTFPIDEPATPAPTDAGSSRLATAVEDRSPYPDLDQPDAFDTAVGLDTEAEPDDAMGRRMRGFLEWGAVIVGALAVALIIKTFLMQAYFIPSSSMEPTLNVGDRVLVNKLSYDFGDISRGDLVVFNRPASQPEGEDDLIKRVVALPGEVVEIRDGEIFITVIDSDQQQRLEEPYLEEGMRTSGLVDTTNCVVPDATTCEVPENHVFVLGDNRPGSRDSRVFGPIPDDLVVGRAFLRVWPLSELSFL